MRLERVGVAVALVVLVALPGCAAESDGSSLPGSAGLVKGGDGRTGEYDVVEGWWKAAPNHADGWTWGQVAGLAVDSPDRIIVVTRGDWIRAEPRQTRRENFIVVADGDGNIVETWNQWDSLLTLPHQVYINPYDPERSIWITESGGAGQHLVLKLSNDGTELLMKLGNPDNPRTQEEARANPNPGPYEFGWPSTLAFLPNGDFLLADGYWNSRIVRYTAEGEYVREWGELGVGPNAPPGAFNLLHGTAVDREGRVYQGDRRNSRIQVFTENGEFIEEWPDIQDPVNVYIDENDAVWVLSAALNRIMKYNRDGVLQYFWGTWGLNWEGGLARPHQIDVDEDGTLYLASYDGGWVNKFVPKQGADPSKLIGRPLIVETE